MNKKDKTKIAKTPRLYGEWPLTAQGEITFAPEQAHYLRNVLRQNPGDRLRLFNGRDGEWLAVLTALDKKTARAVPESVLIPQPDSPTAVHLLFAPIKKARMEWLIEKAVELGATHFHPILTQNTEARHLNEDRLRLQIIEAAEQCERLDIPTLAPLQRLEDNLATWDNTLPLYAALERHDAPHVQNALTSGPTAFLIGPEGGFTAEEKEKILGHNAIQPVSLGPRILRAETAALYVLSQVKD